MFYLIYLVIVFTTVWGLIPISIGIISVLICFFVWMLFDKDIVYVAPCIITPFYIFFRAQSVEYVLGSIVPEFFMIFAFLYFLYNSSKKDYRFPPFIKSIPFVALIAHLLYTSFNGFAYIKISLTYIVFIRVYIVPIVFLLTFLLVAQQNVRLIRKGLIYYFSSICVVVAVALAQYFNIFHIPTGDWINFGRYLTTSETADFLRGTSNVSERQLFGISGIRINLLLGGSLGTIAAFTMCLGLVQLVFKNTISSRFSILMNIGAIICIVGSILTFSTSILTTLIWFFFWILVYKRISLFKVGTIMFVVALFLLQSQMIFEISPLDYFFESIVYSLASLFHQNLLFNWLIGLGPTLNVAGFMMRPENHITDVGVFKVMQESGIINMLFVLLFIFYTYRRIYFFLKFDMSKQRIVCAILFSICLTVIHVNTISQPPFNVLFVLAVAGSLRPIGIIKPKTIS